LALATELARSGVHVDLIACENPAARPGQQIAHIDGLKSHSLPAVCRTRQWRARANGFYRIIQGLKPTPETTVLHDAGLWLPNNHACAAAARHLRLPFVVSPRGMLAPWSLGYHQFKKRLAWLLYQRRDLGTARLLHATSAAEARQFRALGLRQRIAVVPNGVSLPDANRSGRDDPRSSRQGRAGDRIVLFLSRLHPKKGLLDLVDAWATIRPPGWRVVIGGGDAAEHRAEVENAVQTRGLKEYFQFLGQVAEEDKWILYRESDLFVLPSRAENFGQVVAEALGTGLPVITTKETPWSEIIEHRCGWWVAPGPVPLATALREATALSDSERRRLGENGRRLIASKYTWPRAAQQMKSAYERLLA